MKANNVVALLAIGMFATLLITAFTSFEFALGFAIGTGVVAAILTVHEE
jgi:formate dehydrogenase assembly factor FdhD